MALNLVREPHLSCMLVTTRDESGPCYRVFRLLELQGLNAISFITPDEMTTRVYEDFARKGIAKM